jgi:hypothetical protein
MSDDEHCFRYLHPYTRPLFLGSSKEYEVRLDRVVSGTTRRPDFACVVCDIPLLNSEIKPLGYTALERNKYLVKVHLRAKKAINKQLITRGGPGEAYLLTNFGMYSFVICQL